MRNRFRKLAVVTAALGALMSGAVVAGSASPASAVCSWQIEQAAYLVYALGYSVQEAADVFNISVAAMQRWLVAYRYCH
jgi:hypothetical protein